MKGIHNTYCNYIFLNEIIKGRKKESTYSIAFNMLSKLSNIFVDMPKDELKNLIAKDDIFKILNKRENKTIKAKERISEFSPQNICDDLFLINVGDIKDYKRLRQEYGCLIMLPIS